MRNLLVLLTLVFASTAFSADVKISQLPLGNAATTASGDSFPYVASATGVTKRLTLFDLANIPIFGQTFAPKFNPIFTGVVTGTFVGPLTGNVTGNVTGNASTATALAANPIDCSAGTYAAAIAANGNLTCSAVATSELSGTITNAQLAGSIAYSKLNLTGSILNADLAGSIADSKLSTITTAGKVSNSATTGTAANTASAIVARDASGNFSAGAITGTSFVGPLTGSVTGNVTGNVSGTAANVTGIVATANGGTGLNSTATFPSSGTLVTRTATETLSGKTLTSPIISTISNTGTLTLPVSTDTLVGRATTDTLTNKTATDLVISDAVRLSEQASTPSTPASTFKKLYAKTDGKIYTLNSAGVEAAIGSGGGGVSYNLLTNGNFEDSPYSNNWTASGGVVASATSTNILYGLQSATWDSSAAGQTYCYAAQTIPRAFYGQNGVYSARVQTPSGTATHQFYVTDGTNIIGPTSVVTTGTTPQLTQANFTFPSTGTIQACFKSVAANEPLIAIDEVQTGLASNVGTVQQAVLLGGVNISGCSWSTQSSSLTDITTTGCTYTPFGTASAPGTMWPGLTFASMPAGEYMVVYSGAIGLYFVSAGGSNQAVFQLYDGTNSSAEQLSFESTNAATQDSSIAASVNTRIAYATPQTNVTLRFRAALANGGVASQASINKTISYTSASGSIKVYYFPSGAQTAIAANQQRAPNPIQFLSNGTYTPTPGVTYAEVTVVGGGGGGGGAGSSNSGATGGTSSFGSIISASGGGPGGYYAQGGSGGATFTITAPAVEIYRGPGNSGGGGGGGGGQSYSFEGNGGGSSLLGGGGDGSGTNGVANSGGGGGGKNSASYAAGSGAGGGATVVAQVNAPSGPYTITIGAGGTGGVGTSGTGGTGGSGHVIVKEFFGYTTAMIANSVSTDNQSGDKIIRAVAAPASGSCLLTSNSGTGTTVANATGDCTVNFAVPFSGVPVCETTALRNDGNRQHATLYDVTTTYVRFQSRDGANSLGNYPTHIICMGPR